MAKHWWDTFLIDYEVQDPKVDVFSEGRTIKSKKHLEKSDECFFNRNCQSYIYLGNKALATQTHKQQAADSFLSFLSQLSQLSQLLTTKLQVALPKGRLAYGTGANSF